MNLTDAAVQNIWMTEEKASTYEGMSVQNGRQFQELGM